MWVAVLVPSLSVMVPDTMSLSMPPSVIETAPALTPPAAVKALSASAVPASAVVSRMKLVLVGDALLLALSVTEADTVIRLSA